MESVKISFSDYVELALNDELISILFEKQVLLWIDGYIAVNVDGVVERNPETKRLQLSSKAIRSWDYYFFTFYEESLRYRAPFEGLKLLFTNAEGYEVRHELPSADIPLFVNKATTNSYKEEIELLQLIERRDPAGSLKRIFDYKGIKPCKYSKLSNYVSARTVERCASEKDYINGYHPKIETIVFIIFSLQIPVIVAYELLSAFGVNLTMRTIRDQLIYLIISSAQDISQDQAASEWNKHLPALKIKKLDVE